MSRSPKVVPKRLKKVYEDLLSISFVQEANDKKPVYLNDNDLNLIGQMLHFAQPNNQYEACYRKALFYMFRKNKESFMKYINSIGHPELVLWTDSGAIVKHFNLQGKIFLKWTGRYYNVSFHKKYSWPNTSHPLTKSSSEEVENETNSEFVEIKDPPDEEVEEKTNPEFVEIKDPPDEE